MRYISLFMAILAVACMPREQAPSAEIVQLQDQVSRLTARVDSLLSHAAYAQDTAGTTYQTHIAKQEHTTARSIPIKPTKKTAAPDKLIVEKPDTIRLYYAGGKRISVCITPWTHGKRKWSFYSPSGEVTYTIEDMRMSFSQVTEIIRMHDNGAVAEVLTRLNPDASMYWYTSSITFGLQNHPEWKTSQQYPQESVSAPGSNQWYWKNGAWHKQEVVIEQPYVKP